LAEIAYGDSADITPSAAGKKRGSMRIALVTSAAEHSEARWAQGSFAGCASGSD